MKLSVEEIAQKEALNKIYTNSKIGVSGHYIIFLIIFFLLIDKVSLTVSTLGFVAHTIIFTGRIYLVFKYMQIKDTLFDVNSMNHWFLFYKVSVFLIGLVWGLTFFFINNLPAEYHFIVSAIVIGLAAAGLLTLTMDLSVYLSFMLPMLGVSALWMFLQNDTIYLATGLLIVIAIIYYIFIARSFAQNFNLVIIEREKIKEQQKYLQSIIDGVGDPIMVINKDYTISLMNNTLYQNIKNSKDVNLEHLKCYEITHHRSTPCDGLEQPCPLKEVIDTQKHSVVIHKHYDSYGNSRSVELSVTPLLDNEKNCIGVIESSRDITAHIESQDKLREQKNILDYQAHHDALTKLPNRILFNDRLEQSIKKAKRNSTKMALFFIDLDHFKQINDSLGHEIGDEVLKVVTQRLNKIIRKEDTLARLGGDEFTIILEDLIYGQDASRLAQKILETLARPIVIKETLLYVSSSIGISLFPDDKGTAQDLLKYADAAMYKAKDEGRNNFQYYSSEMTELAFERIVMEANLRTALKQEEFVVYYQPQINSNTNELIGLEALVRWQHPTMGLVSPAKFIPLAESTGLIIELDQWVMKTAMAQIVQWYKIGLNPGVLAMNLAMKQLQKKDFTSIFNKLIKETECKTQWLELEVTEGQIMTHPEEAIEVLNQISTLGVELAIDDFGTGYSSLAYLKKLPINKLKIDQSFVRNLPDDNEDAAIAQAVIALAKSLNLKIIAEGVETIEQKEFLINNGCENIQGYFYSKPIPADEMKMYLKKGNIKAAEL